MQTLPVTLYERVIIWQICGGHQVSSLKDAAVYLRLIEKFRLTDREAGETKFGPNGAGGLQWIPPSAVYGNRVIDLEDAEGQALVKALEEHQPVRVNDAAWMLRITEQLTHPAEPAAPEGMNHEDHTAAACL